MTHSPRTLNRRKLIQSGAGATALLGAAAFPGWAKQAQAQANQTGTLETDVAIVGAGMGGLVAAVRAQREGARVVIVEKGSEPGGTMRRSAGVVWTYKTYDDLHHDIVNGEPDLQRTLVETLPTAWAFLDEIGAPLGEEAPLGDVGLGRTIPPQDFTDYMVSTFEEAGGLLLTDTPMTRLATDEFNQISGVLAEGPNGPLRISAKAVIVATGGFAGNAAMVTQYLTPHFEDMWQRNSGFIDNDPYSNPLSTGDGIQAAWAIGAAPSTGGFSGFYAHLLPSSPAQFNYGELTTISQYQGNACIALNLHGQRFMDETYRPYLLRVAEETLAQGVARQPQATAAYVWDENINQEFVLANGGIDKWAAAERVGGPVAKADTLEELTEQMAAWGRGMPADLALETITTFNEAAEAGRAADLPIPKTHPGYTLPVVQPPFYAVLGACGITGTMGGLRVNTEGQVLTGGGRPIKGLYAAGIDVGNIGNVVYCGMLCYGAVFGLLSGANAASEALSA